MKKQVELSITHNGKDVVAYPYTKKEHVQFENGMNIDEFVGQDIATPTITHDTTAIKVGVGDSDVSSSVVDSAVNMTIKGQTYQNILPEPTLRNEMQGKSMQRLNEGYDSIETVDGVSKSAILKGQTLVNLHKKQTYKLQQSVEAQQANKYENIVSRENYLSCDMVEGSMHGWGSYVDLGFVNVDMLKPNTKYLVWFELATVPVKYSVSFMDKDSSNPLGAAYDIPKGQNYAILTTTDEIIKSSQILYVSFYQADVGHYEFKNVMIIEYQDGMENWDIPYFEGMQSVKMPVLKSVGKNLYNKNTSFSGWVNSNGDIIKNGAVGVGDNILSDYIKISPTKRYKMSMAHYQWYYDTNKKYIDQPETVGADITPPNNASYVVVGKSISRLNEQLFSTLDSIQLEEGSTSTSYEPYKSNILTVNEDVTLRKVGDVQDTLDCLTGEVTERIGEIVLDGSENWVVDSNVFNNTYRFALTISNMIRKDWYNIISQEPFVKSNVFKSLDLRVEAHNLDTEHLTGWDVSRVILNINKTKLSENSVNALKTYLQQNPITVQYQLETELIKTVDLSSSGNWEKIVLDGSEVWTLNQQLSNENGYYSFYYKPTDGLVGINRFAEIDCDNFTPTVNVTLINKMNSEWCTWHGWSYGINICIKGDKLPTKDVNGFKQWLRDNPTSVWYPTNSVKDATQVKQPIFFKDGHIIQSSGADNSLIPTLDYQAKTLNSYVMDLMKPNTKYTMKAKTANGTFTIDGANYNVNANGTFTSPSSMTDKLLIMSNKTNEEVMIIEGDVVSKTIPYFKGIKSAFENEDKIEVLSTGKNLFDIAKWHSHQNDGHGYFTINENVVSVTSERDDCYTDTGVITLGILDEKYRDMTFNCKPNTTYTCSFTMNPNKTSSSFIAFFDKNFNVLSYHNFKTSGTSIVSPSNTRYFTIRVGVLLAKGETVVFSNIQVVEGTEKQEYQTNKSNITKIPLLSSLQTVVENVHMTQGSLDNTTGAELVDTICVRSNFIEVVEDTTIVFRNGGLDRKAHILAYDSEKQYVEKLGIVSSCSIPKDRGIKYVRIFMNMNNYEKLTISKSVKAYKGLASLPNGVHDEIVLDRENNKAKIIQRVGEATFVGSEDEEWAMSTNSSASGNPYRYDTRILSGQFKGESDPNVAPKSLLCDQYMTTFFHAVYGGTRKGIALYNNTHFVIQDGTGNLTEFKTHLQSNPTTVYYELASPIITEVDMLGYPFVYKDGHIFLNSEIAPNTEVTYSINQCQQISANNEDILRHEKELTYLQKLIAQYVQVDYESVLLSLKV